MTPEQEKEVFENIVKLNERTKFMRESTRELHHKIDILLVNIDRNRDERYADFSTLRNDISNKVEKLNVYHDKDLEPLKTQLENLTIWSFLQKHYYFLILFVGVVLLAAGEKFYQIIEKKAEDEGIEISYPEEKTTDYIYDYELIAWL